MAGVFNSGSIGGFLSQGSAKERVSSVNGKIGEVVLSAEDVGAATKAEVETLDENIQTSLDNIANAKQDKLTAGENITIEGNIISSSGGGGVQPDWNQNDSTAADYVKNRPFYTGLEETVLVPQQTVALSSGSAKDPFQVQFINGENYTVIYNGTAYDCTAFYHSASSYIMVGNTQPLNGADNGVPFLIYYSPELGGAMFECMGSDESCTISIVQRVETVNKIDNKYIEQNVAVIDKSRTDYENIFNEVADAYTNNKQIIVVADVSTPSGTIYGVPNHVSCITPGKGGTVYFLTCFFTVPQDDDSWIPFSIYTTIYAVYKSRGVLAFEAPWVDFSNSTELVTRNYVDETVSAAKDEMVLNSTTSGSTKQFKITVDDSGTITAAEVS